MTGQSEAILGFRGRQTGKVNGRELSKVCLQTSLAPPLADKSLSPVKEFMVCLFKQKVGSFFLGLLLLCCPQLKMVFQSKRHILG